LITPELQGCQGKFGAMGAEGNGEPIDIKRLTVIMRKAIIV
jgi:hypothetical protein